MLSWSYVNQETQVWQDSWEVLEDQHMAATRQELVVTAIEEANAACIYL